jgi:hypothetical protein
VETERSDVSWIFCGCGGRKIRYASLASRSSPVIAMYEAQNPLDVDIGALKKGEVDLGTSMYFIASVFVLTS